MQIEVYECIHCGQGVQGWEASQCLSQPCPDAPDHEWKRILDPGEDKENLRSEERGFDVIVQ